MRSLTDTYRLHNGINIPCVGFGTWQIPDGEETISSVKKALSSGYRHIDTAQAYGNEKSVGIAVKESNIPREDIFITSKLGNADHGYEKTKTSFEMTLEKLDIDYLDLYLIHWPNPIHFRDDWQKINAETWKAFEELYSKGKIRAIGISNFWIHHINELLKTAKVIPMVNQIRLCPGETSDDLVNYCRKLDIQLEAYSPLGTSQVFDVPELKKLSEKYGKTVAQISLRWSLQNGFLPLPKSVTLSRIVENADIFDFELSKQDIRVISELKGCCGHAADPDHTPF